MIQELQTFKTKKNTMILINRLLEFQAEVCEILRDENNHKIFGYSDMIIDDSELSKILKDRVKVLFKFFKIMRHSQHHFHMH